MSGDRLEVNVTFDERGYIGSAPELRWPVMALSLGGLRRKIEARCCPTTFASCCTRSSRLAGTAPSAGVGAAKQNRAA